jgi:chromosome segregation ATPase
MKSAMRVLAILTCALVLVGCKDTSKEIALDRAVAAETALAKAKADLAKVEKQVASLKEELGAAKSARDELEQQVKQLTSERDKAITAQPASGQEIVNKLPDQLSGQSDKVAELQKTINDQRVIIQQQATALEQLRNIIDRLRRRGAAEPNATAPGQQ